MLNNKVVQTALISLGTFAVVYYVQKKLKPIPVVGPFLPGGA